MRMISVFPALVLSAGLSLADATVEQKTQVHIGGAAGAVINVFSRTAREGATSETVIKGDRKLTRTGGNGEIIDLGEEKVYMVDYDRKTYSVKTFDDLRREYEEQKERARKNASKAGKSEKSEGPEYEVDFDIKSTGNKESINGWNTHQEIVTVTVHEKGKKIEQSGGWVLTSDMGMGPKISAMREIYDFDRRFAQKIYGSSLLDMRQVAMAMAATPAFAKAMKVFSEKRGSFDGTAIRTKMTFETVTGTEGDQQGSGEGGGISGRLLGKMKRKNSEPNRSTLFESTSELTKAESSASAAEVAIPSDFRQR